MNIRVSSNIICGFYRVISYLTVHGELGKQKEDNMNFVHIFKVKGGWQVLITNSPCLRGGDSVVAEVVLATKRDAKRFAKSTGATPWNF